MMSFGKDNVIINSALLIGNEVRVSRKLSRFRYDTINPDKVEYREVNYTPNLKRAITVIDIETTEEVTPNLYFDEKSNEVRGKCKLKPNKSYFAFEIRDI